MKSTTDKVTETTVKPIVWESGLISIDDDFSAAVGRVSYDSYKVMTKISAVTCLSVPAICRKQLQSRSD